MPYHVPPSVLARSRSTVSPLAETWGELMTVVHAAHRATGPRRAAGSLDTGRPRPTGTPARPTRHGGEHPDARAALDSWIHSTPGDAALRRGVSQLVASTKWLPDFVGITPPPSGEPHLLDEVALISSWPDDAYRATVQDAAAQSWLRHDLAWTCGDHLGERTASALCDAWEHFVAPDWSRRRGILDREIAHRSALVATQGWAAALEGMTRHLRWLDPDLLVISPRQRESLTLDSHLAFIPTTQSAGWWTCDGPVGLGLVYAARGTGVGQRRPPDQALARLVGHGRALVLRELDTPATPSQLAAALSLSLGTVGGHLRVLLDAGLVDRARRSRAVYYTRTEVGDALVAAAPVPGSTPADLAEGTKGR